MQKAKSIREAFGIARELGFPLRLSASLVPHPPFVCENEVEFARHLRRGLRRSPIREVRMERVYAQAPVVLDQCQLVRDAKEALDALVGPLAEFTNKPLEFRVMRWRNPADKRSATVARFISMNATDRISTLAYAFQERAARGYGFVMIRPIDAVEAYGVADLLQARKQLGGRAEFSPWYTLAPFGPWRTSARKNGEMVAKVLRRARKHAPLGIHRVLKLGR